MTAPICTICGSAGCGGGAACPGPVVVWEGRCEDETGEHS